MAHSTASLWLLNTSSMKDTEKGLVLDEGKVGWGHRGDNTYQASLQEHHYMLHRQSCPGEHKKIKAWREAERHICSPQLRALGRKT